MTNMVISKVQTIMELEMSVLLINGQSEIDWTNILMCDVPVRNIARVV